MISSLDAAVQSYTSQLFSSQQAQTVTDPFLPGPATGGAGASTASGNVAGSNNLTGSGTASLDSQTLGALLGLAQQDPTDPSQQPSQAQGAHRHHHHHGGGVSQASSTASKAATASTSDPATDAAAEAEDVDASLESALLSA